MRASVFLSAVAFLALQVIFPGVSLSSDEADSKRRPKQAGEDRWVPSLAITAGVSIQRQYGTANSVLFEDMTPPPVPLGGFHVGDDTAVSPFVGVDLQLMTPALPVPTRPRLFVSAEILPTFASARDLALDGDPGCVRGPEPDAPCARDEDGSRRTPFGEDAANGEGTRTRAQINPLVYGAALGASFPLQISDRPIRIKPSVAFMSYRVDAAGVVVDAACDPSSACTDWTFLAGFPPIPGFLRETTLTASRSQRYYAVGPGLDIEMDAGQYGSLGAALFIGGRAYAVLGDRTMSFGTEETYDDQLGMDRAVAQFNVEVDPWMFRAHVGLRLQWLGSSK
jgi:outer membrane protein W